MNKTKIQEENTAKEEIASQITHEVTLYTDAKVSKNRFAVCDRDGEVVWYGQFYHTEDAGEQSRGELCAAGKAVWLASKIREELALPAIQLNLIVDAQWLTYQDHGGQKGYRLTYQAIKLKVDLHITWISGTKNPADSWTIESGYKKWQDNYLPSLARPIEQEVKNE